MKKKELIERLARANELVLKQDKVFGMVRIENQMLIKTIQSQKKELKQGQDNYDKLWDMYSELKKENKELEEEMRNLTTELILNMLKENK